MSDLSGETAFDNVMDRLLDLNSRIDAVTRERDESRAAKCEIDRKASVLETRAIRAEEELRRLKAAIPPEQLAAIEQKIAASDEIPF